MTLYGVLRDIERASNAAERDRIRRKNQAQKEMMRINAQNQREYEKQQKIEYYNLQMSKTENMTNQILQLYKKYDEFINYVLRSGKLFSFENFHKSYEASTFQYYVAPPQKMYNSANIKIPRESKLTNKVSFLKNRRLSKINQKELLKKQEEEQYAYALQYYESEKSKAYELFLEEENRKKESIENYNKKVDSWKLGCENLKKGAIDKYLAHMLNFLLIRTNNKLINKLQYDLSDKHLICELYMKKEKEIFPCEGYRYFKQKDSIEPILTKRITVNNKLKTIIPNLAIAFIDILYKNDELNLFDNIVVNVYYERKCCASLKLSKDEYASFNLNDEDSYYYVYDHYMKNYKVLTTGVKPFDTIYMDLV